MNPARVDRDRLNQFTDLPNVGKAFAADLRLLGFRHPLEVRGQDARELYDQLCCLTGARQDPCVLDVLLSITSFLEGAPARPWWEFSEQRKAQWWEPQAAPRSDP